MGHWDKDAMERVSPAAGSYIACGWSRPLTNRIHCMRVIGLKIL